MDVPWTPGWFVVEVGRRQSWPFFTLADAGGLAEVRVYIDTTFSVAPRWTGMRQDDDAALVALDSLNGLTVASSKAGREGLVVDFGAQTLEVESHGNNLTTHDLWWTD